MPTLLDYALTKASTTSAGGSHAAAFTGVTPITGPGTTAIGSYPKAIELSATAQAVVDLTGLSPDRSRFTIDVTLRVDAVPAGRQVILDCAELPFTVAVAPGTAAGTFAVEATVGIAAGAKTGVSTAFAASLQPGAWYTATVAYDVDTLAIFVDNVISSVHGYPQGAITAAGAQSLTIGSAADGSAHFVGALAAVRWNDDIPSNLEVQLDDRRSGAEWHITYKNESPGVDLGAVSGSIAADPASGASIQNYASGLIMFTDGAGVAFEMHGDIWQEYRSLSDASPLGSLVSDEMNSLKPGGRKNLFSTGAIYWSPATRAVPLVGHLFLDYERLGEAASILGFPTALATAVPNGFEQIFEGGRMYVRNGAGAAHEVHGAILGEFLATGSVGTWGFPLTDESPVMHDSAEVGRFSEFENATFYWTAASGAHEVHGDIRAKYRDLGAAIGSLGFPTSDEGDIAGAPAPARMNSFQNGSILWYGNFASIVVPGPFTLFFGRFDTEEEEGAFMGQNDLYWKLTVRQGASTVFDQRFPSSGDMGNHNVYDWNYTVPVTLVPSTADDISFTLDVWDSDDGAPFGGGDDHLGTWNHSLTAADGWGLNTNGGILSSGAFSDIHNITASVKPVVDVASLTPGQKWWGVRNIGTDPVSYPQYSAAFEDVDSSPELWDATDWLDKAFYAAVIKHFTKGGNCFGMSLEGINAIKGSSLFSLPLDRFTDWNVVGNEFNVKHQYQVGAAPIWWFLGQFVTGNTHAPTSVFDATADAYARGDNPVLCISQNWDFSGAAHCIMPIAWDKTVSPWEMTVCDPNFPASTRTLQVNPDNDSYHYQGASAYDGTSSSGGRMHYMPYHLLSHRQDTPIWDAIMLLLAGTVLIVGDDAETAGVADPRGNDLDAFGQRAGLAVASQGRLDDYFFSVKGTSDPLTATKAQIFDRAIDLTKFDRDILIRPDGPISGELHLRHAQAVRDTVLSKRRRIVVGPRIGLEVESHVLTALKATPMFEKVLAADPATALAVGARTPQSTLADPALMKRLDPGIIGALKGLIAPVDTDFIHHFTGKRQGTFDYAIKSGLTTIHVSTPIDAGEQASVQLVGLGTSKSVVTLAAAQAKSATIRIEHRLGIGSDRLGITLDGLPLARGADIQVNAKPGLGGVEVTAGRQAVDVAVTIDGVINGRPVGQRFSVGLEGGIRIKPASMLSQGSLQVAKIAQLFGPSLGSSVVAPMA
jgi:hypothetical protein